MIARVCAILASSICLAAGFGEASLLPPSIFKGLSGLANLNEKSFFPTLRMPTLPAFDDIGIRSAFNNISNGSPDMDRNSFSSALDRLHIGVCSCEIKEIFLEMDENHDGHVSFQVLMSRISTAWTNHTWDNFRNNGVCRSFETRSIDWAASDE
jgi:hypothetical protein